MQLVVGLVLVAASLGQGRLGVVWVVWRLLTHPQVRLGGLEVDGGEEVGVQLVVGLVLVAASLGQGRLGVVWVVWRLLTHLQVRLGGLEVDGGEELGEQLVVGLPLLVLVAASLGQGRLGMVWVEWHLLINVARLPIMHLNLDGNDPVPNERCLLLVRTKQFIRGKPVRFGYKVTIIY